LRRIVAAALSFVLLCAVASCKHPDTFNGCAQHPGQCDRTK
jgi:hypothetical protein